MEATAEALQRKIAWGLEEVREHLLEEDFATESGVSKAIFKFDCLEDMDSLDFFTYKSTDAGVESEYKLGVKWECRLMADRKVSSCWMNAGAKLLPYLHTNNICLITPPNTDEQQTVKLKANIPDTSHATWTFLPNGNIMVFGFYTGAGGIGMVNTAIIELNGTARQACNLLSPRYGAGVICLGDYVYCLGGYHHPNSLSSCEKYTIDADRWFSMSKMNSDRYYFNAIGYGGLAYICGGKTLDCEVFNPENDTFAYLNFKLPQSSYTTTLLHEKEIIILTTSCVTIYNPKTKEMRGTLSATGNVRVSCDPIIINDIAFLVHTPSFGGIDGFRLLDLKTFSFLK